LEVARLDLGLAPRATDADVPRLFNVALELASTRKQPSLESDPDLSELSADGTHYGAGGESGGSQFVDMALRWRASVADEAASNVAARACAGATDDAAPTCSAAFCSSAERLESALEAQAQTTATEAEAPIAAGMEREPPPRAPFPLAARARSSLESPAAQRAVLTPGAPTGAALAVAAAVPAAVLTHAQSAAQAAVAAQAASKLAAAKAAKAAEALAEKVAKVTALAAAHAAVAASRAAAAAVEKEPQPVAVERGSSRSSSDRSSPPILSSRTATRGSADSAGALAEAITAKSQQGRIRTRAAIDTAAAEVEVAAASLAALVEQRQQAAAATVVGRDATSGSLSKRS
jgi:hypothetical protein